MCIIDPRRHFFVNAEDLTVLPELRKCSLNSQDNLDFIISLMEKSYIQENAKVSFGMCEGISGMQNKSVNGHGICLVEKQQCGKAD